MTGALVVLSGGQDSTTCLAWAMAFCPGPVHAITFNYNQRHGREIEAARTVAKMLQAASHEVLDLGPILKGSSPLVDHSKSVGHYGGVKDLPGGVEPTFVAGRNILFLTIAANRAMVLGVSTIVIGVCEEDFGGYPDCRQTFITAMERALRVGLFAHDDLSSKLRIITPLMHLTKKQTVQLADSLPGCMEALAYSHTCYDGEYPPNPKNHASLLRARGFKEAGVPDPLILRAIKEGLLPADYPPHGLVEDA